MPGTGLNVVERLVFGVVTVGGMVMMVASLGVSVGGSVAAPAVVPSGGRFWVGMTMWP